MEINEGVICLMLKDQVKKFPPWVKDGAVWLLQLTLRIEKFVEYSRNPDLANVFVKW